MMKFTKLVKKNQNEMKKFLVKHLKEKGYTPIVEDGFIYARGDLPILLTAHMDTVHMEKPREIVIVNDMISSPQGIGGDDRCGIFMIMSIINDKSLKPYILFCEDEEIGCVGSDKFCKTEYITELEKMKYLIELDRANGDDAVFYDCGNKEFKQFIIENTGYKESCGSFSDISNLSPYSDVASVNLSCGYYNAHTLNEYVVMSEMYHTIDVVKKLLSMNMNEVPFFDYQEDFYGKYGYRYEKSYSYGNWYDYYEEDGYYSSIFSNGETTSTFSLCYYEYDEDADISSLKTTIIEAKSLEECIGKFCIAHPSVPYEMIISYEEY